MSAEREPRWQKLGTSVIHSGRVLLVEHAVAFEDGTTSRYEVDESVPFAVATLVVDGDYVILARQYRYPIDRWIHDLPGGGGRTDESPIEAATRELEEELGLVAKEMAPLSTFFMNPGRSAWPVHLFIGRDVVFTGRRDTSDPAEQVRHVRMTWSELDAGIASGEIVDPALLIARVTGAAKGVLPPLTG